jgi:hypothetical protein
MPIDELLAYFEFWNGQRDETIYFDRLCCPGA